MDAPDEIVWPTLEETLAVPEVGRTTALLAKAGIRDPRWCARAMEMLFGTGAVFKALSHDAPDDTFLWQIVEECARLGTHPLRADSDATLSAFVLPAWQRAYPQYTLNGANNLTLRNAIPPRKRDAEWLRSRMQIDVHELRDNGVILTDAMEHILALPSKEASEAYLISPMWASIREALETDTTDAPTHHLVRLGAFHLTFAADAFVEVGGDSALSNGVSYKLPAIQGSSDLLQKVRAIYRAMDAPARYAMLGAGADYAVCTPPRDDGRVAVPRTISSALFDARARWLRNVYGPFIHQYVLLSLCVAHTEYVNVFFRPHNIMENGRMRSASELLRRAAIREFSATMDAEVLRQLTLDLEHPAVAYTHALHEEEVRYWIWCALEHTFAEELLARAREAARAATTDATRRDARNVKYWHLSYARALGQYSLASTDIVNGLVQWGGRVSDQWLEAVLAQWRTAHDSGTCGSERVVSFWTALKAEARERGVLAAETALPAMRGTLDGIVRLAYARFALYTLHKEPAAHLSSTRVAEEADRVNSDGYWAYLSEMNPEDRAFEDLSNYLTKVWMPLVGHRTTPRVLFELHAKWDSLLITNVHTLDQNDISIPSFVRNNPGEYVMPDFVDGEDVRVLGDRARLARMAVNGHRERVAAHNWHAAFFAQWTRPNTEKLRSVLSYVARLDAYEHVALQLDANARARPGIQPWTLTCEELGQARLVVCAESWPLYRKWDNVRVTWEATVSFGARRAATINVAHAVIAHTLPQLELRGATLLAELHGGAHTKGGHRARIEVTCTVEGAFFTTPGLPATEQLRAAQTCILNILDY